MSEKGLSTQVFNEGTIRTAGLWDTLLESQRPSSIPPHRSTPNYSAKVWKDDSFCKCSALTVDEAHCIKDWWNDNLPPAYATSMLATPGLNVHELACTVTCRMEMFDLLGSMLGYGERPL